MDELEKWLTSLGLATLAPTLRAHDIDLDILSELNDADLEKLGLSLGHRRKLLRAAAGLSRPAPAPPPTTPPEPPAKPAAGASAERRQLTVMFCDLVGSTALSSQLDPEDMREILDVYYRRAHEIITREGGVVGRYIGDGILAYFGYPQAHEDDPERAVRAALSLVEVVPTIATRHDTPLQVRLGIATGVVVIGDLIGEGAARDQGAVGDTPNLAARLQAVAGPGEVVISQDTRRLAGAHFEYKDLGRLALKGIAEPVQAWQAVGTRSFESRFAAQHEASLVPLVGRNEELELLLRQWRLAKEGHGSVVLLSGEPGIGKSRITQALDERLAGEPHTSLHFFCSPHHHDSAFYPIIAHFERAAGFRREDSPEQRLDKLEAVLAPAMKNRGEAAALLAALLSIPAERYPQVDLMPQVRKERTLRALMAQVEALAARQPLVVIVEDLHWSDASTIEVLNLIFDQVPSLPILVVATFRPEFEPPWLRSPHVSLINLSRLAMRHCVELISGVVEGRALPPEIAEQIVSRTDGVPLFIEELTKAVLESGALAEAGDKYVATGPLPTMSIPLTLQASLLARLDHLAPAREVAQIGAALGRQFSHELISAVAAMPQAQLNDALSQLQGAELIYRRGSGADAEYSFKHALVQDAAYSTLLRGRRLQLHGRIVDTLESQFAQLVASQPQLLAHHCTEAGRTEQALGYRMKAAQLAVARSAMKEAEGQLRRGLALLSQLPEGSAREKHELEFSIALARALIATQGHAAPEVAEVQARARQLWERLGQPPEAWISNQFEYRLTRAELALARQEAQEIINRGKTASNPLTTIAGCNMIATVSFFLGDFTASCDYGQEALDLLAEVRDPRDRGAVYRQTVARSYRFLSKFYLGHLDQALAQSQEAQAAARAHSFSLALALACGLHMQAEPAHRARRCEELEAHAGEHGFPIFAAHATVFRGSALSALGRTDEGLELLEKGLAAYRATGAMLQVPGFLTELAEGCGRCGRAEQGLDHLAEAAEMIERSEERWTEAYMLRTRGELLIALGDRDGAEASLQQAIAVAQRQRARLWELRAATSLARLWREQGRNGEARTLLAPICGWFAEGLDSPDLSRANSLLQQLA
jgi:class 3 adenylate cyclase/tetratricopeptide (TPR) repeat protein